MLEPIPTPLNYATDTKLPQNGSDYNTFYYWLTPTARIFAGNRLVFNHTTPCNWQQWKQQTKFLSMTTADDWDIFFCCCSCWAYICRHAICGRQTKNGAYNEPNKNGLRVEWVIVGIFHSWNCHQHKFLIASHSFIHSFTDK